MHNHNVVERERENEYKTYISIASLQKWPFAEDLTCHMVILVTSRIGFVMKNSTSNGCDELGPSFSCEILVLKTLEHRELKVLREFKGTW